MAENFQKGLTIYCVWDTLVKWIVQFIIFCLEMSDLSCSNFYLNQYGAQFPDQPMFSLQDYEAFSPNIFTYGKGFFDEDVNGQKQFGPTGPSFENQSQENQQGPQPRIEQQSQRIQIKKNIHFSEKELSSTRRRPQIIQTSIQTKANRHNKMRGEGKQTKNLFKHLFTLISNYLNMLINSNELSEEGKNLAKDFSQKKGQINFVCFKQLLSRKQLGQKCQEYFESKEFAATLMSSRADIKSKLTFIKYMEVVQSLSDKSAGGRWKNWRYRND